MPREGSLSIAKSTRRPGWACSRAFRSVSTPIEALLQERYGWVQDRFGVSWQVMADPHYQSPAKVKELAEACGFRPSARHGNRFQYSLVLEKPERS